MGRFISGKKRTQKDDRKLHDISIRGAQEIIWCAYVTQRRLNNRNLGHVVKVLFNVNLLPRKKMPREHFPHLSSLFLTRSARKRVKSWMKALHLSVCQEMSGNGKSLRENDLISSFSEALIVIDNIRLCGCWRCGASSRSFQFFFVYISSIHKGMLIIFVTFTVTKNIFNDLESLFKSL